MLCSLGKLLRRGSKSPRGNDRRGFVNLGEGAGQPQSGRLLRRYAQTPQSGE